MKKIIRKILIAIGVIIALILLDTAQAVIFKNDPIIGYRDDIDEYLKRKVGLIVTTQTYCNYYKQIRYNFRAYLLARPLKGCEGEDINTVIKENIVNLAAVIDNTPNYHENADYKNLMIFVASPKAIEEMYKDGEFTDKEAYVSALAIEGITKCDVASEFDKKWDTGDEFFELWDKSECKEKKKLYKALEIYE